MVNLQYRNLTMEQIKLFVVMMEKLSKTQLKQLGDLTNRTFKANILPVRPPFIFDGKPYLKIGPEATCTHSRFVSITEDLTLQIRKLTGLSTDELDHVKAICDEIYKSIDGQTFKFRQNPVCANCNKGYGKNEPFPRDNNGKLCGGICKRCRNARYCSKLCQREHWEVHRKDCKKNKN